MSDKILTEEQQDAQTDRYLKTNGPPPGAFKPDVPELMLEGATKRERYLMEMVYICAKQNEWQIKEIIGLKGAHRTIYSRLSEGDERFTKIDATLSAFTAFQTRWLHRGAVVKMIIGTLLTILILPALVEIVVEVFKHHMGW